MNRFAIGLSLLLLSPAAFSMTCYGTCKIKVPGGSYEENVDRDILSPKTWDDKVTVKVGAHDEVRDVTMPTVPDSVKSLAEARPHMDNFCASHFNNYTGLSSVKSCNFPPTAAEIKAQKKQELEWAKQQKKEEAEQAIAQKKYQAEQKKLKDIQIAAEKKDAANFKKLISGLASPGKCAAGEVSITSSQSVKLAGGGTYTALQGCAKKVGKALQLTSGVVQIPGKGIYAQVSKNALNGKALGAGEETGSSLIYKNGSLVSGKSIKNGYDSEGDYREEVTYEGDKSVKKIFRPSPDTGEFVFFSSFEYKKGKLVSSIEDGEEKQFNHKGEVFATARMEGGYKVLDCISKPDYKDKKSFYKHCVDEDYYSPITKIFSKLEDRYPEMKKIQNKLQTTFRVRFDPSKKCIMKSSTNKTSIKLNPDMKYTDSQWDNTIEKKYKLSETDDNEIYTILVSGKSLRQTCSDIGVEPRSNHLGAYGPIKKAVYCKPSADDENLDD